MYMFHVFRTLIFPFLCLAVLPVRSQALPDSSHKCMYESAIRQIALIQNSSGYNATDELIEAIRGLGKVTEEDLLEPLSNNVIPTLIQLFDRATYSLLISEAFNALNHHKGHPKVVEMFVNGARHNTERRGYYFQALYKLKTLGSKKALARLLLDPKMSKYHNKILTFLFAEGHPYSAISDLFQYFKPLMLKENEPLRVVLTYVSLLTKPYVQLARLHFRLAAISNESVLKGLHLPDFPFLFHVVGPEKLKGLVDNELTKMEDALADMITFSIYKGQGDELGPIKSVPTQYNTIMSDITTAFIAAGSPIQSKKLAHALVRLLTIENPEMQSDVREVFSNINERLLIDIRDELIDELDSLIDNKAFNSGSRLNFAIALGSLGDIGQAHAQKVTQIIYDGREQIPDYISALAAVRPMQREVREILLTEIDDWSDYSYSMQMFALNALPDVQRTILIGTRIYSTFYNRMSASEYLKEKRTLYTKYYLRDFKLISHHLLKENKYESLVQLLEVLIRLPTEQERLSIAGLQMVDTLGSKADALIPYLVAEVLNANTKAYKRDVIMDVLSRLDVKRVLSSVLPYRQGMTNLSKKLFLKRFKLLKELCQTNLRKLPSENNSELLHHISLGLNIESVFENLKTGD